MVSITDRTADEIAETRQALKAFARAGYELFPLKAGSKIPYEEGWQTKQYALAREIAAAVKDGCNIGVRLRPVDLVIDDDPRNHPGDDPLTRLCFDVGVDLTAAPTVLSGRGEGRHFYWRKPAGLRIHPKLPEYKGVDFKAFGGFVVAPGSIHPDTGGTYRVDPDAPAISDVRDAPDALLALIAREDNAIRIGGEGAGAMSNEQMAAMLAVLDPADYGRGHYDRWIALAAAAHDATGGGGLIEFLAWCAGDPNYADEASQERVVRHWESFRAGKRGGATYRTLLRAVADARRPDLVAAFDTDYEAPFGSPDIGTEDLPHYDFGGER